MYQSEISRIIFIGCNLPVFIPKIKRLQDVEFNNQYNNLYLEEDAETNHHEEMQGRVLISFHVDIENEIFCHETRMSALIFRFRETSGSENQSLSWRSRYIQVTIYQSCCYLFIVVMNLIT